MVAVLNISQFEMVIFKVLSRGLIISSQKEPADSYTL